MVSNLTFADAVAQERSRIASLAGPGVDVRVVRNTRALSVIVTDGRTVDRVFSDTPTRYTGSIHQVASSGTFLTPAAIGGLIICGQKRLVN